MELRSWCAKKASCVVNCLDIGWLGARVIAGIGQRIRTFDWAYSYPSSLPTQSTSAEYRLYADMRRLKICSHGSPLFADAGIGLVRYDVIEGFLGLLTIGRVPRS